MTEKITREEIEALLKLAQAASPYRWVNDAPGCVAIHWKEGGKATICVAPNEGREDIANAAFIAAANPVVLKALCTLALQAEAMQPRPIEEYTGSVGPVIVYVPNDRWIDAWYSKANGWWTTDIYGLAEKKNEKNFVVEPTHFIPLNSLPEPRR